MTKLGWMFGSNAGVKHSFNILVVSALWRDVTNQIQNRLYDCPVPGTEIALSHTEIGCSLAGSFLSPYIRGFWFVASNYPTRPTLFSIFLILVSFHTPKAKVKLIQCGRYQTRGLPWVLRCATLGNLQDCPTALVQLRSTTWHH